jgi:hypothetical protein
MPEAVTVGLWAFRRHYERNAMSIYLNYNALTARTEAENLTRAQFDVEGLVIRDEPLRTKAANLLRRVADAQLSLAARLDDSYVARVAA